MGTAPRRRHRLSAPRFRLIFWFGVGLLTSLVVPLGTAGAQDEPGAAWTPSDFVWPLSASDQVDDPLTSPFGPRLRGSQSFAYDFHRGIDIQAPVGTPIYAVADATIRIAGEHPAYRDMLVQLRLVRAGQPTLYVNYTHLSQVVVAEGQQVTQGELLGYTGVSESGFAHLHFEIREGGLYQRHARNPVAFLPYPDTFGHVPTIEIVDSSSRDDGSGHDVVVAVTAAQGELDIESVQLSVHTEQQLDAPAPAAIGELTDWTFGLEQLNFDQTPVIDGSSDTAILDDPVVTLDPESGASVHLAPGRYDGRNPPWDVATYTFTFRGVPIPDPSGSAFHLAATVGDSRQNAVTTWSSPTQPLAFGPTDDTAFHRGVGEMQDLRLVWTDPLDGADQLTGDEISCTPACTVAAVVGDPATGIYDVTIDPAPTTEDLVVTVAAGALTDLNGRPTSQSSTVFTLDNWAPEVVGEIDVVPTASGWLRDPATITWRAADPTPSSGFAVPDIAVTTVDQLGVHTYVTDTFCDTLGNCRSGAFTIGFDDIAPAITITGGPGPDSMINQEELTALTCSATDAHSGVDAAGCVVTSMNVLIGPSTEQVRASAVATDLAGNTSTVEWAFQIVEATPPGRYVFRAIAEDLNAELVDDAELSADDRADMSRALASLAELDEDHNWSDDASLDDTRGPTAYRLAQTALRAIDHIGTPGAAGATGQLLDTLRQLSVGRLHAAELNGGHPELLARAEARLVTGDRFGDDGRWSRASTYYRYAWFWAREAGRSPVAPPAT